MKKLFPLLILILTGVIGYASGSIIKLPELRQVSATITPDAQGVIYVKKEGAGTQSGNSWANAVAELANALEAARTNTAVKEVWVAAGTYYPEYDPFGSSVPADSRHKTFFIRDGLKVYGRFSGNESTPADRNLKINETILSGDIGTIGTFSDNTYHVVLAIGSPSSQQGVTIDGLNITGGSASNTGSIDVNGAYVSNFCGGGIYIAKGANRLINCRIYSNNGSAPSSRGAGIYLGPGSHELVHNAIYSNTLTPVSASGSVVGAGIFCADGATKLINNTLYGNTGTGSSSVGGAIAVERFMSLHLLNNIFRANEASSASDVLGAVNVANNNVLQESQNRYNFSVSANNLFATNPAFAAPAGADNVSGTGDDDFSLPANSPAKDAGLNSAIPDYITNDLIGSPRIFNNTVDIGALEYTPVNSVPVALADQITIANNAGATPIDVLANDSDADLDELIITGVTPPTSGGTVTYTSANVNFTPEAGFLGEVNFSYSISDNNGGTANATVKVTVARPIAIPDADGVLYVKKGGAGSRTGDSWANAMSELADALECENKADIRQIWVAAGTYYPLYKFGKWNRNISFVLYDGTNREIYGGFAGTETLLSERDWKNNVTVLSGDLNRDGKLNGGDAYHVVVSAYETGNCLLSGFTITGGNANDEESGFDIEGTGFTNTSGGGIVTYASDATFSDLVITGNAAINGAGISNHPGGSPVFVNVIVQGNSASKAGGGIYQSVSDMTLINVLIANNKAGTSGGAMKEIFRRPWPTRLFNVTIAGNSAPESGAISAESEMNIVNSIIYGNGTDGINASYTAKNSLIQEDENSTDGNIPGSVDPMFKDPANGIYRLMDCSPGINAGNNTWVLRGLITDLDGNTRIQLRQVDLGAYEASEKIAAGNPQTLTHYSATAEQERDGTTFYLANCDQLVAALTGYGSAEALAGSVTTKVWIDNSQPANYVKRYYEIIPAQNRSGAEVTATLYFSNEEFQSYNQQNPSPDKLLPDATDAATIGERAANLIIEKRSGNGGETGQPQNYTGASVNITPTSITWDETFSRWEVTFDVVGFSGFFVKTDNSPLPVRLISFQATAAEAQVSLDWKISDATRFSHFEVERSYDGLVFDLIGRVNYRPELSEYRFTDKQAQHLAYYRLRMTDTDGSYAYSPLRMIRNEGKRLSAYPNPFQGSITLFSALRQQAIISDITGRVVATLQLVKGENSWAASNLPSGLYVIRTQSGEVIKVIRE